MKKLTIAEHTELSELMERFGLRPVEQEAYLHLLQGGAATVSPIAAGLGKPVSTTQSVVSRLVRLGVVDVTQRGSRKIFHASEPTKFKRLAERQLQDASHLADLLTALRPEKQTGSAKVRMYPRERLADVLHLILSAKSKSVCEIASARDLQDLLGERFHFTQRRVKNKIKLKSLRVEATEIKRYSKASHERDLREARFLPAGTLFRSSLAFWDDMIVLYPVKREGMIIVIESASLREMLEELFNILWSIGRRMETEVSA